ncbi:MAG TPA: ABC transporter permease [Symbiobacteriaceae bacterium]|jgi:ABC-2 type transport system permease protein|nr:ABC transporter permease [Symbiobacteriaceae bacterium]
MRKVWLIAVNALARLARDRKALIMLLLMPMVLIGILGSALAGMMGDGKIEPFPVIVVNQDTGVTAPATINLGKLLATDVLESDQVKELLQVTNSTDLAGARQQVADGKTVAVIHVPATFTADVLAGKPATVNVLTDPGKPTQAGIVEQIVRSFTEEVTTGTLSARVLGPQQSQAIDRAKLPQLVNVPSGAKSVSAMQYYSVAMALMFLLMTAFNRAKQILQDREEGTLSRILLSPTGRWTIIAGQMLGSVVVTLTQFLLLMAGTALLYRVDWGNWGTTLLLAFCYSLAAAGIGMMAAGVLKDPRAADSGMGVVSNIFAALSGGMFPLYIFPESLKLVAKFTPNYWALQGFLDQFSGLGVAYLWAPVAVLTAIGLVTGALGAWRLAVR